MSRIICFGLYEKEVKLYEILDELARKNDTTVTAVIKAMLTYSLNAYRNNVYVREYIDYLSKEIHTKKTIPVRYLRKTK